MRVLTDVLLLLARGLHQNALGFSRRYFLYVYVALSYAPFMSVYLADYDLMAYLGLYRHQWGQYDFASTGEKDSDGRTIGLGLELHHLIIRFVPLAPRHETISLHYPRSCGQRSLRLYQGAGDMHLVLQILADRSPPMYSCWH